MLCWWISNLFHWDRIFLIIFSQLQSTSKFILEIVIFMNELNFTFDFKALNFLFITFTLLLEHVCFKSESFPQILRSLQWSYLPIQLFFWPHAVWYISYQSLSHSWHTDLDYGSYRFSNVEIGLTAGVTGQQEMLTPPWHLIPPLIYSEVLVRPLSDLYFL
jgi:hypothetical protein